MKLIFFGGCFDPPHRGHYEIIKCFLAEYDKFLIIPTLHSPQKNRSLTESRHILNMLELLIKKINYPIQIDKYDLLQTGPTYTINTINYLKKKYPQYSISMIIGLDQLTQFKSWKSYNDIMESIHFFIINRPGYNFNQISGMNYTWVHDLSMDVSSKQIREDIISNNINNKHLFNEIKNYIIDNNLYGN